MTIPSTLDKPRPLRKAFRFNFPQPQRSGQRVIGLTGIHQAYGEKKVYENLDLDIERGERTVLVSTHEPGWFDGLATAEVRLADGRVAA